MTFLPKLPLTLIFACGAVAAHAAPAALTPAQAAARAAEVDAVLSLRANALVPKAAGTNERPGTPQANPFRSYPPSCAAHPLPDKPAGPAVSQRVVLFKTDASHQTQALEEVAVTVWRVPCSSSGGATRYSPDGGPSAITLVRIDRDAAFEGVATQFPTVPWFRIEQGDVEFADNKLARAAVEPNTVISDLGYDSAIINSTTFVLENYPVESYGYFEFNDAFKLKADPNLGVIGYVPPTFTVPAYEPTAASYPDAFAARPLDGYAAAQWVNAEFNEGLLLQVTEQYEAGTMVRQVVFDLLLEDTNGDPLWLVGNAAFAANAHSLEIELGYLGNGLQLLPWVPRRSN